MIRIEFTYKTPFMKKAKSVATNEETQAVAEAVMNTMFKENPEYLVSVAYYDLETRLSDIRAGKF